MKQNVNYFYLNAVVADIQQQVQASPAYQLFNQEKIKRFYGSNQHRINIMNTNMQAIAVKYCTMDEHGTPIVKDGKFVFDNEGKEKAYAEAIGEFMNKTFDLIF